MVQTTRINEAIVVDNTHVVKVIDAEIDSTSITDLKDNEFALKLDEAWYNELYSNKLHIFESGGPDYVV